MSKAKEHRKCKCCGAVLENNYQQYCLDCLLKQTASENSKTRNTAKMRLYARGYDKSEISFELEKRELFKKKCIVCGEEFYDSDSRALTCENDECRKYFKRYRHRYAKKGVVRNVCLKCGEDIGKDYAHYCLKCTVKMYWNAKDYRERNSATKSFRRVWGLSHPYTHEKLNKAIGDYYVQ